MKVKTSVSINEKVHEKVKRIAKKQDRSVSYIMEKYIEQRALELPDAGPSKQAPARRKVKYSSAAKKRSSG